MPPTESYRLALKAHSISSSLITKILENGRDQIQIHLLDHEEITRDLLMKFVQEELTKKVMYEKFGLWSKEVRIKKEKHPVLISENIKLFNDNNLYTVFTKGFENTKGSGNHVKENNFHKQAKGSNHEIYASVIVLDSTGGDCLSDNNQVLKKLIIEYFSNGIKNLTSNNEFYDIYWKSVKRKKVKN